MQIYVFLSDANPSVIAFTTKEAGENLPRDYAPWRAAGDSQTSYDSVNEPISQAVHRDGFCVLSV